MQSAQSSSVWKTYRFPIVILCSIIIGSILGLTFGEKVKILKPLGDIFINLMFTIVVPLVFFTLTNAIASMTSLVRLGKIVFTLFFIFIITGVIAAIIMITAVKFVEPGKIDVVQTQSESAQQRMQRLEGLQTETGSFTVATIEQLDERIAVIESRTGVVDNRTTGDKVVAALTANDFNKLLSRGKMLAIILFAAIFGVATVMVGGEKSQMISKGLDAISEVLMVMIKIIMYYAPIGLMAYFAVLVGEFGPQLLKEYARTMAIYYPVTIGYFFIFFALYAYLAAGKDGVASYFKNILNPAMTALATQSSVATLPVNLEAAKAIGVKKDIRNVVLPLGATMHMDGSCLSAILKISFLFGVYGMDFAGIDTYMLAILIAVLSGVVMSGIPGGGLIGEALIVTLFGFPIEALPLIATIGYLVDPPATMVNVSGDTVAAMLVSRIIEGKGWRTKAA